MKQIMFKYLVLATLILSCFYTASSVFAAQHGNSNSGVRNTERWHQLSYFGEAWTNRPGQSAWISYYRRGVKIATFSVYKDSWRRDSTKYYKSGTVWDSLNPKAPKTVYRYSY